MLSDFGMCVEGDGGMFWQGFSLEAENPHVARQILEIQLAPGLRDGRCASQGCRLLPSECWSNIWIVISILRELRSFDLTPIASLDFYI
jgi:hypothetical protein